MFFTRFFAGTARPGYNHWPMFGPLGLPEILLILGLGLLVFGPKRLPEMGRTIGRTMGEFRKASNDLKRSIQVEMDAEERRQEAEERERRRRAQEAAAAKETQALPAATIHDPVAAEQAARERAASEDAGETVGETAPPAGQTTQTEPSETGSSQTEPSEAQASETKAS